TLDSETVSNLLSGVMDISGALTLKNHSSIDNNTSANTETIEAPGALTLLDTSFVTGGEVINKGTLNLQGTSSLQHGALANSGQLNASGTANALHAETITNTGTIEVLAHGALAIDQASTVDNTNGHLTVDSTGLLTLNAATVTAGTVTNN